MGFIWSISDNSTGKRQWSSRSVSRLKFVHSKSSPYYIYRVATTCIKMNRLQWALLSRGRLGTVYFPTRRWFIHKPLASSLGAVNRGSADTRWLSFFSLCLFKIGHRSRQKTLCSNGGEKTLTVIWAPGSTT